MYNAQIKSKASTNLTAFLKADGKSVFSHKKTITISVSLLS